MIEKLRIELLQEGFILLLIDNHYKFSEFFDVQQFEIERDMDMMESINDEKFLMCPLCLKV